MSYTRKFRWSRLTAVCLALASMTAGAQESEMDGRELYTTYQCWQCHGYEGQGGAAVRVAPTVLPYEAFARLVRHTNVMPAYSPNVLSDEALRSIYDFVRSIPEPPPLEDIPALRDN